MAWGGWRCSRIRRTNRVKTGDLGGLSLTCQHSQISLGRGSHLTALNMQFQKVGIVSFPLSIWPFIAVPFHHFTLGYLALLECASQIRSDGWFIVADKGGTAHKLGPPGCPAALVYRNGQYQCKLAESNLANESLARMIMVQKSFEIVWVEAKLWTSQSQGKSWLATRSLGAPQECMTGFRRLQLWLHFWIWVNSVWWWVDELWHSEGLDVCGSHSAHENGSAHYWWPEAEHAVCHRQHHQWARDYINLCTGTCTSIYTIV